VIHRNYQALILLLLSLYALMSCTKGQNISPETSSPPTETSELLDESAPPISPKETPTNIIPICPISPLARSNNTTISMNFGAMGIKDRLGYIGVNSQVVVFDLDCNCIVGKSEVIPDAVLSGPLAFSENLLFIGASSGLFTFNIQNPLSPQYISALLLPGTIITEIALVEDQPYLYLGLAKNRTVEVRYPNPRYQYLGMASNGIGVIDIRDPQNPRLVDCKDTRNTVWDMETLGNILFATNADRFNYQAGGLYFFDVSEPDEPMQISFLELGDAADIEIRGDYAYLIGYDATSFGYGLYIYNITEKHNPIFFGKYTPPSDVPFSELTLTNRFAYLRGVFCELDFCFSSMDILDISNPYEIQEVTDIHEIELETSNNLTGWMVVVNGKVYLVVEDAIEIWDTAKRGEWKMIGKIELP
jgi:hypothetical protein